MIRAKGVSGQVADRSTAPKARPATYIMEEFAIEQVMPHGYRLHVQIDWFPQPYPPNVHLVNDRESNEGALIGAGDGAPTRRE